jgi:hypothetical protein
LLHLLIFFAFFYEVFQSVDVVFATFKPGIVVSAPFNLVILLEYSINRTIMKLLCVMARYNLIMGSHNKKDGNTDVCYSFIRRPKHTQNQSLKESQIRKNIVSHG